MFILKYKYLFLNLPDDWYPTAGVGQTLNKTNIVRSSFGENVSDDEIVDRMKAWDGDGDGTINFAEFLNAMAQILTDTDNDERMRDAFRIFDKVWAKVIILGDFWIFLATNSLTKVAQIYGNF